jgi:hypothetical protein
MDGCWWTKGVEWTDISGWTFVDECCQMDGTGRRLDKCQLQGRTDVKQTLTMTTDECNGRQWWWPMIVVNNMTNVML